MAQYTPEQESFARSKGFQNYDQMRAFYLARQNRRGTDAPAIKGASPTQGPTAPPPPPPPPPANDNALSWHPAVMFDKLAKLLGGG